MAALAAAPFVVGAPKPTHRHRGGAGAADGARPPAVCAPRCRRVAAGAAAATGLHHTGFAPPSAALVPSATASNAGVDICIQPGPSNSRCVWAGVDVAAPVEAVWLALTAYESLDDFIPGLAENRCLERRATGCRLLQVGRQELALGLRFSARCVLDIDEHLCGLPEGGLTTLPPPAAAWPPWGSGSSSSSVDGGSGGGGGTAFPSWFGSLEEQGGEASEGEFDEGRLLRPRSPLSSSSSAPCRDIAFRLVDGDFQAFQGVWRLQEGRGGPGSTRLSYSLFVRPAGWLPVALVEARIKSEIGANLAAVRDHVQRQQQQQRQRREGQLQQRQARQRDAGGGGAL